MAYLTFFFVLLSLWAMAATAGAKLSSDFYAKSCPSALPIIQKGVKAAISLVETLKDVCPLAGAEETVIPLDETPTVFDNSLFKNLMNLKGVLQTDQLLYNNASTDSLVKKYSVDSAAFFSDFGKAMIKMGNLNILTGENGEIRTNCRVVN